MEDSSNIDSENTCCSTCHNTECKGKGWFCSMCCIKQQYCEIYKEREKYNKYYKGGLQDGQ